MKKCITLTVVLSTLLVNQAVAMDGGFSPRHQRTNSAPIPKPSPRVTIDGLDSPGLSPKGKSPLGGIDGTIPLSPKQQKSQSPTINIEFPSSSSSSNPQFRPGRLDLSLGWAKYDNLQANTQAINAQLAIQEEKIKQNILLTNAQVAQIQANTQALAAQTNRENSKANRTFFQKFQEPAVLIQGASLLLTAAQILPSLIKSFYPDPQTAQMNGIAIKTAEFKFEQMEKKAQREEAMEMMGLQQYNLVLKKEAYKVKTIARIDELLEKKQNGQELSEDEKEDLEYRRDILRSLAKEELPAQAAA